MIYLVFPVHAGSTAIDLLRIKINIPKIWKQTLKLLLQLHRLSNKLPYKMLQLSCIPVYHLQIMSYIFHLITIISLDV